MNETTIITISSVVLLLVIGIFFYRFKTMDSFDITVDPVRYQQLQQTSGCPGVDKTSCGRIETSNGPTYKQFIKAYKGTLNNNNNMINYCTFMYENFHDDFTERWHSLSECEATLEGGFYDE